MDTSKTMYRISTNMRPEIKEIKVVSETDKTVVIQVKPDYKRREHKKSQWDEIYPTWKEAHDRLLVLVANHVVHAENRLDASKDMKSKVEAMKCPK